MKAEILKLLKDSPEYLSGQELCDRFGVSRTAVWKAVNQLKKEGFQIEAVQNKGYKLVDSPVDILGKSELESRIRTKWCGRRVQYYEQTGSTNIQAKRLAEEGAAGGTLVVADMQTDGRGRRGRGWISPAGTNVYYTLLLRPQFQPDKASMLTLVMALAVARAVEDVTGVSTHIKWPNDVVMNGRKMVGILTEMSAESDYIHHIVIGVGINVGEQQFPEELADRVTSVDREAGRKIPRAELIQKCMEYFETYYESFAECGSMSGLMGEYHDYLINRGRSVRVLDPRGEYGGMAEGINENGELLVRLEDGSIRAVYAGEVSVRGVNGYV